MTSNETSHLTSKNVLSCHNPKSQLLPNAFDPCRRIYGLRPTDRLGLSPPGRLCEAPYEVHHHTRIAREIGMGEALIAAPKVGASAPGLDATQRLALSLTDDLVRDRKASDTNLAQAIKLFGESGLNEIIMLVGCYVLACMLLRT